VRDFGWEIAHAAVSRRPPISLVTIVARTEGYTHAAKVWALFIVQGPFSVAPCQTLALRFHNVFVAVCWYPDARGRAGEQLNEAQLGSMGASSRYAFRPSGLSLQVRSGDAITQTTTLPSGTWLSVDAYPQLDGPGAEY
jgi:hypothetical protein